MDKKHSSEIAVKIARCSTFQLHKHTQHILLIHKKLQLYTIEIINNIYKIINHIKNTKNDARSIKIKVMDKNTAVKTIKCSTFQLRKHAHSILKCSKDKNI